ncbi:hypothetical protein NHQ30_005048 [Ciborinia camelliae]|nr:hypothetical protein NHQ30_005048 [Ciborinia camelliae]
MRASGAIPRSDDTRLLIAVFSQWEPIRIDANQLGEALGIRPGAAAMRWTRFKTRLKAGTAPAATDQELLVAVLRQMGRLPRIDFHRLGADLGINPGAAAMRWARFKERYGINTRVREEPLEDKPVEKKPMEKKTREAPAQHQEENIAGRGPSNDAETSRQSTADGENNVPDQTVIRWPYNDGWRVDEA